MGHPDVCTQPAVFLFSGFVVFPLSHMVDPYLEPLIVCLVAGFIISNRSDRRVARLYVTFMMWCRIFMLSFLVEPRCAHNYTLALNTPAERLVLMSHCL